ncbi:MAG: sugar phosphate nucleotidyltransferase, partial [candidate division Zixibacteria bacterium]
MKVIIPVAGVGTRLRPHTYAAPKPLLMVANKPILAHLLDPILAMSPEEVIFVVGYKGEMIEDWVSKNYSFKTTFVQQDKLLGLGYAINMAMKHVDSGPLLIVLGDTIVQCDLSQLVKQGDYVLGLRQVDDPTRFGIAEVSGGNIVNLEEKPAQPKTNLAVIGVYYFSDAKPLKQVLAAHVDSGRRTRNEIQLTDALQDLIEQGHQCKPFEVQAWFDCGKKETVLESNSHLLNSLPEAKAIESVSITQPVWIDPSATVRNCKLGPNVTVC